MEFKNPVVSIIIPVYNYAKYLAFTLDSVLGQTFLDWECIIVDDGSKDQTKDVASEYLNKDKRFRYIYQANKGLPGARNTGLLAARGTYIQFLDADDLMHEKKLELQTNHLFKHPEVDLVYSDVRMFYDGEDYLTSSRNFILPANKVSGTGEILIRNLIEDNIFLVHCPLFKRSVINKSGLFREDLKSLEDWHFWYRIALYNHQFFYLNEEHAVVYVRGHGDNMSANKKRMWESKVMAREDLISIIKRNKMNINLNPQSIHSVILLHKKFLYQDKARMHLYYQSISKGALYTVLFAFYGRQLFSPFYDAAYWIKERIKK